ncbi:hypothetical protein J6590_017208 [Homalodisca vitripennis]|nr:hypothetical protein J6590_017208 [Homalodisca vitripennis]
MEDVYFMNPCISQAIKCAENIDGLLEQEMISKAYVFIPINDSKGAMEHSRKECKALSGVDTANRYDVLDGHSEIYEKENRLPINNLSANNLTKRISTDKSILVKTKNGVKDRKIKLQFGMEVNLCSDSQGSLLSSRLEELSNGRVKCFGLVRANTTLTQVIDSASLSDDSPVILQGGSNDSLNGDFQDIYSNLENQLLLLSKTKPVFITSIPKRFDEDFRIVDDQDLRLVNNYITELTNRLNNVFLIDLSDFRRFHYTTQGLHLNKRGKSKLAYLILNALSKWKSTVTSGNLKKSMNINSNPEDCNKQLLNLISHPKNCINLIEEDMVDTLSRSELEVNSPSEPSDVIGSGKEIKVLDADMWQVIEDLKSNDSIAFAHSISGDFDHPRRMTAGVAVTFAKQFGKPQRTDCITEFLACQRSDPQAAAIYSLITKDHYYGKPKKKDYDRAFLDLTLEFKKRKFSTLVCSPIGCVRDHV